MLKNYCILAGMFLGSLTAGAQTTSGTGPRYAQSDALLAPNRLNERPRYGGLVKTAQQLEADKTFVAEALRQYGNAPAAAQAHVNFGWHYLATGHLPTAIKRFNQAWLLDSTSADVYYGFSAYLHQLARPVQATQYEQLAQRHDQGNAALLRYYASLAYGQSVRRDYAGAIATNQRILALDADNASAHSRMGYFFMQQQDTVRASHHLSRAVELNPQDSVSFLDRGWVRYQQKAYPQAIADFTRAIGINPHYVSAYANRGLAYADAGNLAAAIADWQTCLGLVAPRDQGEFYLMMAHAKLKANDKKGACAAWQQALLVAVTPDGEKQIRRLMKSNCR
ncbi:tetratricopeptide repeat protein [Hymenobacter aquaticus]|uniref:Tetratricopeptide repeat protein n=1 Tax=Hymenobacter aquaticus TaxID=1867101 RepID=A0A4Z0Q5A0_9BACT|nr:tetratricopeptide repeat protein [Hymenobacter aquaticus]TGE24323.1 tetratricopeptide repeat protein [Hymenobacter aquaticus]